MIYNTNKYYITNHSYYIIIIIIIIIIMFIFTIIITCFIIRVGSLRAAPSAVDINLQTKKRQNVKKTNKRKKNINPQI